MAQSFSLSSQVSIFSCPSCEETINTSMPLCPFCQVSIDPVAAQSAAEAMSLISQACSDASYLKIMAGLLIPFFFLQLVIFLSLAGLVGFRFLEVAIPVMTIRWWFKFGSIVTDDPDFTRAKRSATFVSIVAAICLLLLLSTVIGWLR